jgi:hypothetical protein
MIHAGHWTPEKECAMLFLEDPLSLNAIYAKYLSSAKHELAFCY